MAPLPSSPASRRAREHGPATPAIESALRTLRPTRAVVDLDAIAANFEYLRERAGGSQLLCVVKADAYGHGAVPVALRLQREGARWFGVALVEEGIELRNAGIEERILLLGGADLAQLELAVASDLVPAVVSHESFDALRRLAARLGRPLGCHLKVDTGMSRLGIPWPEFARFVENLAPDGPVRVEGLFTHLASSDDPSVPFTRVQLDRFHACRDVIAARGLGRPLLHVASSAGLLTRAESDVELVRPGLALYGLNPFGNARAPELTPALSLVSKVERVAEVPAGTAVGYGCAFITVRPSRLATIPVGYEDGLPRALSDNWEIAIGGRLAPLVGRVSMDLVVADATDLPGVAVGDDVAVVGGPPPAHPVEELARRVRTIPYEVSCGISTRVPRVHVAGGRIVSVSSRFAQALA